MGAKEVWEDIVLWPILGMFLGAIQLHLYVCLRQMWEGGVGLFCMIVWSKCVERNQIIF